MVEKTIEALHKKLNFLHYFRTNVESLAESPEGIETELREAINCLDPIDPTQRIQIPAAQNITLQFPKKQYRGKPVHIKTAPHDTGLFLLPYTGPFREAFITAFKKDLAPITSLMKQLRALELAYHDEEKSIAIEEAGSTAEKDQTEEGDKTKEGDKKEKKKTVNRFLNDYRFFKYLYTTVPDNTKLGNLLLEIGEIILQRKIEIGHMAEQMDAEDKENRIGPVLREAIIQFRKVAMLCDNMFVSSIASWAALSSFVSIRAKDMEKQLIATFSSDIYQASYLQFERFIKELTEPFSGSPTNMQVKALYYAYLTMKTFLSGKRHPKDFFRLNNFSQMGAGKTYTTPIFIKMFSVMIGNKQIAKGSRPAPYVTLFLTEANLCENVIKSMIERGAAKNTLHNPKLKDISSLDLQSGDCVVLSRHEVGLKDAAAINRPLETLIRRGFHFMLVSDESSFLKNMESGISSAVETLIGYLKKRRVLWVDYRLTATPANNDTGDFLYLLASNLINLGSFLHRYPDIASYMNSCVETIFSFCRKRIALPQLLNLLRMSQSRTGVLICANLIEVKNENASTKRMYELFYTDCAGAILLLYYEAIYHLGLFSIKPWLGKNREGDSIRPGILDFMKKLGISYLRVVQPFHDEVPPLIGLERPLVHSGSRDLDALIPCLPLLNEMTSALTYDRALNAEDEVHFQINAKQLQPNLLESVTNLEVLEKIRQFLNLTMFVHLVRKVRSYHRAWRAVQRDVERECRTLRLEFLATYAYMHGVALTQKQEEVRRRVHKGFHIVEETEHHPYLAAKAEQKEEILALLEGMSDGAILGHRLFEELAQFFAPVRYFELLTLLDKQDKEKMTRGCAIEGDEIEKKRAMIMETLAVALNFKNPGESFNQMMSVFKTDLAQVAKEEDKLFHFRPSILTKYPVFLTEILSTLQELAKGLAEFEGQRINEVLHDIGSGNVDLAQTLAEYGIIFKASESVNFPLVLRFADRILHRISALLASENITLEIGEGDVDQIRKVIAKCASFENYAAQMSKLTQSHEVPLLISCRYRFSQESLLAATQADFSVTGQTEKAARYRVLEAFDRLGDEMGRTLVVTTKSILKGFNLFYAQYGFMSEGMDNAEVRMQMAGRLRPLFPQHMEQINELERSLLQSKPDAPVIRHLRRLKENVKIFDVVSPQIISGFPDIQNGKAFMLNTLLFSQTHQRSFPDIFTDEEVFHFVDTKPIFNAATVERFCKKSIEESIDRYVKAKGRDHALSVPELIALLEKEIQEVAESNMKLSSYFEFLTA